MRRGAARAVLLAALAWPAVGAADGPGAPPGGGNASGPVAKESRRAVWEPGPGGMQVALWPEGVAVARPEADGPEEVGNGSRLVAGREWHWAGPVSRPTMTVFRPAGPGVRGAVLVLPGGGYAVVAMDLDGTEICDRVVRWGMVCAVLKYRVP